MHESHVIWIVYLFNVWIVLYVLHCFVSMSVLAKLRLITYINIVGSKDKHIIGAWLGGGEFC